MIINSSSNAWSPVYEKSGFSCFGLVDLRLKVRAEDETGVPGSGLLRPLTQFDQNAFMRKKFGTVQFMLFFSFLFNFMGCSSSVQSRENSYESHESIEKADPFPGQASPVEIARLSRNSSLNAVRRLSTEFAEVLKGENQFRIQISDANVTVWQAVISAPVGCPYEGASFIIDLIFPSTYPFEPPKASFRTPIFHPNISTTGAICLDILKASGSWTPLMTVESLLVSIQSLLDDPNPSDPLNIEAAELFLRNRSAYNKRAREGFHSMTKAHRADPFAYLQESRDGRVIDEDDAASMAIHNSRTIK